MECVTSIVATVGIWHLLLLGTPGRQEGAEASELSICGARELRYLSISSQHLLVESHSGGGKKR